MRDTCIKSCVLVQWLLWIGPLITRESRQHVTSWGDSWSKQMGSTGADLCWLTKCTVPSTGSEFFMHIFKLYKRHTPSLWDLEQKMINVQITWQRTEAWKIFFRRMNSTQDTKSTKQGWKYTQRVMRQHWEILNSHASNRNGNWFKNKQQKPALRHDNIAGQVWPGWGGFIFKLQESRIYVPQTQWY